MLTQPQFGDREIPCIYAEEGCAWVGRKRDVLSHLQHDCEWQDPLSRQKSFESEKKRRQSLHVLYTSICRDEATDIDDRRSFPLVETLGLKSFSWIDDDQDGLMSFDEFARGLDAMTDADRVRMDDICAILETLAEGHAVTASESKLVFDVLSGDGSRVSVQSLLRFGCRAVEEAIAYHGLPRSGFLSLDQLTQLVTVEYASEPAFDALHTMSRCASHAAFSRCSSQAALSSASRCSSAAMLPRKPPAELLDDGLRLLFVWLTGSDAARLADAERARLAVRLGLTQLVWYANDGDGLMGLAEFKEMLEKMPPEATQDIFAAARVLADPQSVRPASASHKQGLEQLFTTLCGGKPFLDGPAFLQYAEQAGLALTDAVPPYASWEYSDFVGVLCAGLTPPPTACAGSPLLQRNSSAVSALSFARSSPPAPPAAAAGGGKAGRRRIRYQKGEMIGEGGFGQVFLGMDQSNGKLIAIKECRIESDAQIKALREEIALLRTLEHPCIVCYLGETETDTGISIQMEYVPGGSIQSLLAKFGKFKESVIVAYTYQLLQGLEYLHDCQVIHRDIKAANVLVTDRGEVKVSDFGTSQKLECVEEAEANVDLYGTPLWMAPESVRGEGYSPASDLWSLGCTVIEMATGEKPWAEKGFDNHIAALFHISQCDEGPKVPCDLSPKARNFVSLCLALDPAERPSVKMLLEHALMCAELDADWESSASRSPVAMSQSPMSSELPRALASLSPSPLASPAHSQGSSLAPTPTNAAGLSPHDSPRSIGSLPWTPRLVRSASSSPKNHVAFSYLHEEQPAGPRTLMPGQKAFSFMNRGDKRLSHRRARRGTVFDMELAEDALQQIQAHNSFLKSRTRLMNLMAPRRARGSPQGSPGLPSHRRLGLPGFSPQASPRSPTHRPASSSPQGSARSVTSLSVEVPVS